MCLLLTCLLGSPALFADEASFVSNRRSPFVQHVERASESTVNIHTEKRQKSLDVVFSTGQGQKINGMGTGIVIDERGYIVTNFHVVEDAEVLKVTLSDGSFYYAKVIDTDPAEDLAIIKIDSPRKLKVMPMGTSSDLFLGEDVVAIGNPFGYENSISRGVISNRSRDVDVTDHQSYRNLIQTDAAINPGNSGGPLINADGELIGINVAIRAKAQRIGFAIQVDDARRIIANLLSIERRDQHHHGLVLRDEKNGRNRRLIVQAVVPGSPSEEAGIEPGDVVVKANDVNIVDRVDLERSLLGQRTGAKVPVLVNRDGKEVSVNLEMTLLPPSRRSPGHQRLPSLAAPVAQVAEQSTSNDLCWKSLGLKLVPVERGDASLNGQPYRGGMRVVDVLGESPAARNGLKNGDVLVGLHVYETVTQENVDYVLTQSPSIAPLKFYIVRGGETLFGSFETQLSSR
ncbi:MAG: trypsin-like peptidase domain-containing protein [Planctomycetaceae bacterium]|nr:trypsin-like peptidase domain-containing protein [Planctomycetaceae bacterium]MCB9949986.1 trypsin-like peptidase domain-containing protein [Planctomycetaceae bacterium]